MGRGEFYEERGWKIENVEEMGGEGVEIRGEELIKREKRKQEMER